MDVLRDAIREKKVKALVKVLFKEDLVPGQESIVKAIAYGQQPRVLVNCMTRYGKSFSVAIGVLLYILFHEKKRVLLIAPTINQANILRNYLSDFMLRCPIFIELTEADKSDLGRLKREFNKRRITFRNGCELMVLSAEGTGDRLMGFGGDLIVEDEAGLIADKVYESKISRMLGDSPDSVYVALGNPWDRLNHFFRHFINPEFVKIHVGYEQAIGEGRVTPEFIEEQRVLLSPADFMVLYESKFPAEAEDSVYVFNDIISAENLDFKMSEEIETYVTILDSPQDYTESEVNKAKKEIKLYRRVLSCDPAGKGPDETVVFWGLTKDNRYEVHGVFSEFKTEPMKLVGRLVSKVEEWDKHVLVDLFIDPIGLGEGTTDRLREVLKEKGLSHVRVIECHNGKAAKNSDIYLNKKAENHFRLEALFREGLISLQHLGSQPKLREQLMAIRWDRTSSSKKKILDPENYSPDWAMALVYFVWDERNALHFAFV